MDRPRSGAATPISCLQDEKRTYSARSRSHASRRVPGACDRSRAPPHMRRNLRPRPPDDVERLRDRAVTPQCQRRMQAAAGVDCVVASTPTIRPSTRPSRNGHGPGDLHRSGSSWRVTHRGSSCAEPESNELKGLTEERSQRNASRGSGAGRGLGTTGRGVRSTNSGLTCSIVFHVRSNPFERSVLRFSVPHVCPTRSNGQAKLHLSI
jgi:hypothetical protein